MAAQLLTETERRLRAAVRASLSRSVWVVIVVQLLLLVSLQPSAEESSVSFARAVATVLNIVALVFLVAGTSYALAQTREAVGIRQMMIAGREVYRPFLWLLVKAALISGVAVNVMLVSAQVFFGVDVKAVAAITLQVFATLAPLAGLLFVYWFPTMFVERDFRLFATLAKAPGILWRHKSKAVFLAILALAPAVAALFLPESPSFFLVMVASAVSSFLGWIAYVYCAEQLQAERIS